jgi:hypothetical protein
MGQLGCHGSDVGGRGFNKLGREGNLGEVFRLAIIAWRDVSIVLIPYSTVQTPIITYLILGLLHAGQDRTGRV